MAKKIEIHYVTWQESVNPAERISAVGGTFKDRTWQLSLQAAVVAIEHGVYSFFMTMFDTVHDVTVTQLKGKKYLRTSGDVGELHHLLMLPPCPPPAKTKK